MDILSNVDTLLYKDFEHCQKFRFFGDYSLSRPRNSVLLYVYFYAKSERNSQISETICLQMINFMTSNIIFSKIKTQQR